VLRVLRWRFLFAILNNMRVVDWVKGKSVKDFHKYSKKSSLGVREKRRATFASWRVAGARGMQKNL
jgi:hypothetical protein